MNDLVTIHGDEFDLFVPLSKINEKTGEFEAWATLEEIDQSNEIIDIDKSWPYFEALADRFGKLSGGANFGPIREQHDPNRASGHLIQKPVVKEHSPGVRGIYVNGLVTDDSTRKKLAAKTLTGVSIGGRYVGDVEKVTIGGREAKKFVADPNHYGLVDSPCVKNALVTVVKMDGTEQQERLVGFEPPQGFLCRGEEFHVRKQDARGCTEHVLAKAAPKMCACCKDGGCGCDSLDGRECACHADCQECQDDDCKGLAAEKLAKSAASASADAASEVANGYSYRTPEGKDFADYHRNAKAAHEKAAGAQRLAQDAAKGRGESATARHHGKMADQHDAHASAHGAIAAAHEAAAKVETAGDVQKIAERKDVSEADRKRAESEASNFADEKNKKYKLDSEEQIRAAWSYINMPKNAKKYSAEDAAKVKAKIVAAWKAKIDKDGPPSAEKSMKNALIQKCLQCVATLAYNTESIDRLADGIHCPTCSAYGCGQSCEPRCTGPRCGCCYACNMQFGADAPLSDGTVAMIEAAAKQLYAAVISGAQDAQAADDAEDAEEEVGKTIKILDDLLAKMQDKETREAFRKMLRVPAGNGGGVSKSKEGTMSETNNDQGTTTDLTKVDGAQILKGIDDLKGDLKKSIDAITATLAKSDERVTATEGDIKKLDEGMSALTKGLAPILAMMARVDVADPTDLAAVTKAIADKPAPVQGVVRPMRKVDDGAQGGDVQKKDDPPQGDEVFAKARRIL